MSGSAEALIGRTGDRAIDVVFEASGSAAGLTTAIQSVRRGGTVVQIGNLPGGLPPIPANAIMAKEINLLGSFRFGAEFATAVEMIATGAIDVTQIISGTVPLRDAPQALGLALDRSRSMKVMLVAE